MSSRAPVDAPRALVFDVNETLSDLTGMRASFTAAGLDPHVAPAWFAGVLRDGFALTIADATARFADVARAGLRARGADEDGVEIVIGAFMTLSTHPDVVPGVGMLSERGHRLATLSNGATAVAQRLLDNAGLRGAFEAVLSVEDAGAWKPHPRAYAYAGQRLGLEPGEMMLVAVHPWDIDGAARAGLRTAWICRDDLPYPGVFAEPELTATGIDELAAMFG